MRWFDFVGLIGVFLIVLTYFLLQIGKIRSDEVSYSFFNALGAGLVIISLCFDFNFSAFIVEFFWMLVSIYGLIKNFGKR
ncbi:MAG: hypothetical protein N2Z23_07485 [Pyrinomonadaceae bacterium]|nr:hypothetical protein [Pyrinomonadaceae bacterium]MCX7640266.1 hypothetical protein [Pyrinomonadaceae bacterium]MDW8305286.1 hypothetical protein [Acidobacteriota bacterium]